MSSHDKRASAYKARSIRNISDLEAVSEEWLGLWREHGRSNPFTHPSWIRSWLKHLGGNVRPLIVALYQENRLTGLAPLGISRLGPWRRLVLLGSPMADYPDFLIHPDHFPSIGFLTNYLLDQSWNWMDFIDIHDNSTAFRGIIESLSLSGYSPTIDQASLCPGVVLDGSWEAYWAQKKSKTRYTINKKVKRLSSETGPINLEMLTDGESVLSGLREVADLHAARWARQHTRTVFSDKMGVSFFHEALAGLCAEGIVRLYLYRSGNTLIAFCLSFVGDRTHLYYIPGFDQTQARNSPGHLLLREIIRESYQENLNLFDFMKGDEEYKFRWANNHHYTMRLLFSKNDPWSGIGFCLRKSFLGFRDWARSNAVARKIYFGALNPLARLRKFFGE